MKVGTEFKAGGGGYVFNERNQLQENSAILVEASRCASSVESLVHNSQTGQLAKSV